MASTTTFTDKEGIKIKLDKTGKVFSRISMYNGIAAHADKIVETLFECLSDTNSAVRMGAAKILINKILPDLKSIEVKNDDKGQFLITISPQQLTKDAAEKLLRASEIRSAEYAKSD